ncbi:11592_t:CDS:2, partial [Gigaspora rosea]
EFAGRPSESAKSEDVVRMSAQESNLVRQARSEEEELKVTKKRKHDEGKETAAICSINTITQKITQEHGIMVNDLNSRSELTPKNLAITSPESGKVNNTEKEMDPGQITGMNIDENESEQYVDPEMIVENEDMAGSTGIAWEEEAESKLGLVKGTRTYSQVTRVVKNGNEERKDTEIAEDTQNQAIR